MMNYFFTLVCIVCSFQLLQAQNVIIKQDVDRDFEKEEMDELGPNKKYYKSTFTSFGMLFGAPDNPGSSITPYRSFFYATGARHKHQFSKRFGLGHDASLNFRTFYITQNSSKTFMGNIQHRSERLFNINANITIYSRINLKAKRGNQLGKYLDFAFYGEYAALTRYVVTDKLENPNGAEISKTYLRGLPYINKLNYGAEFRLGLRHMLFFVQYRLSDMIRYSYDHPYSELPRFCAGVNFDVPRDLYKGR
jgi:hypothetical protein